MCSLFLRLWLIQERGNILQFLCGHGLRHYRHLLAFTSSSLRAAQAILKVLDLAHQVGVANAVQPGAQSHDSRSAKRPATPFGRLTSYPVC